MDESVPGSANFLPWPGLCARPFRLRRPRACGVDRSSTLCEKKRKQFATSSLEAALTELPRPPRVRDAPSTERTRLMALRSAVGESRRSVGKPDEGATGSVHFRVRVHALAAIGGRRSAPRIRCRKLRRISTAGCLTGEGAVPRVRDAPSTECLRLMALRVVVASAVVSRKVGRGRNRLGAFRCLLKDDRGVGRFASVTKAIVAKQAQSCSRDPDEPLQV